MPQMRFFQGIDHVNCSLTNNHFQMKGYKYCENDPFKFFLNAYLDYK